jgi:hypothetical protein
MSYQLYFDFRTPEQKAAHDASVKEINTELDDIFDEEERLDKFLDLIPFGVGHKVREFYYSCRWNIKCTYQKIRYGVSDDDIFSLYDNISKFLIPRLQYFKKHGKKGIPVEFVPHDYHLLSESEMKIADEKADREWGSILDEIIFAFDYTIDSDKYAPFPEILMKDPFDKINFNRDRTPEEKEAWNNYIALCNQLNERKKKGLELFAKHFDNLWV